MIYFIVVAVLVAATALLLTLLRPDAQFQAAASTLDEPDSGQGEALNPLVLTRALPTEPVEIAELPDVFSEDQLRRDLEMFADTPSAFDQYVKRLRTRLTKQGQIKILDHWTKFFESGARLVRAKTDLGRARSDYRQLSFEDEIELKKKDVELARLDAELEEQMTRKAQAIQQRTPKPDGPSEKDEDDIKQRAAVERHRRDISFDVRLKAGKKLTTLRELQKWFREERNATFNDDTLTHEEQDEQYEQLRSSFNEYKRQLNVDVDIFEDD